MQDNFFQQINSQVLQSLILDANTKLCYAAPGIQQGPAEAIVQLAERIGAELIMVFLNVDESVICMGYGDIAAVQSLQQAGISVQHISGLRNGLIVSDGEGYSYTPTALFGKPSDEDVELWLGSELASAFPTAEELVNKMQLDVSFKDVTFETLNGDDFLSAIKQAFPEANWDKTYEEFRAAGESE